MMELVHFMLLEQWPEALNAITSFPEQVKSPDTKGRLPIHWASYQSHVPLQVIEALLTSYPESVQQPTHGGLVPLHNAILCDSPNDTVLQLLLQKYPKAVVMKDQHGRTPLHTYLHCRPSPSFDILQKFIEAHPGVVLMTDSWKWTPLHCAASKGHWELSQYLIKLYPEALWKQDKGCNTPRGLAMRMGHESLCGKLREEEEKYFGINE